MYRQDPSNLKFKLLTAILTIFLFGQMSQLKAQNCYSSFAFSIAGNYTVDFVDYSSNVTGNESYSWNFDDGTFANQEDVTHTFASAGTYNVCLSISDASNCSSTKCREVTLAGTTCNTPEIETYFYSGTYGTFKVDAIFDQTYNNTNWEATNTTTGTVLGTGSSRYFNMYFNDPGEYQTCFTADVLDANGDFICATNKCEQFTVTLPPYEYSMTWIVGPGYQVTYNLVEQNGAPLPTNVEWFDGNGPAGVNGTGQTFTHTYPGPGNYSMQMQYSTPGTNSYGSASANVSFDNPNGTTCDLPVNISYVNNTASLLFYSPENTTANDIVWRIIPGGQSIDYLYTNPASFAATGDNGYHNIQLTTDLVHDDGTSCLTNDNLYFITNCYSTVSSTVVNDSTVSFGVDFPNDAGLQADSVEWRIIAPNNAETFGQGIPFNYTFNESGHYIVCQTNKSGNNCYSQNCDKIYLGDLVCDYQAEGPAIGTTYQADTYTLTPTNGAQLPDEISWYVLGQTGFIGSGPTIDHAFLESGTYDVCADYSLAGSSCIGTECTTITIDPACSYGIQNYGNGTNFNFENLNGSVTPDDIIWYLDGDSIGVGETLNYNFPLGTHHICASYWVDGTACSGEVCSFFTFTPQNCGSQTAQSYFIENYDYNLGLASGGATFETVNWYFASDGTAIGSGASYVHSFPAEGVYEVCADFTILGEPTCGGTACTFVNVSDNPNCVVDFTYSANADSTYTFELYNPQNMSIQSFEWSYEEVSTGATSTFYDNPLTISFGAPGTYEVCVVAGMPSNSCYADTCKLIVIGNAIPCEYDIDVAIGIDPFNYDFTLTHSNPDPSAIFSTWYVDNVYQDAGLDFSYDFGTTGTYEVCVNYNANNEACQGSTCTSVTVTDPSATCDLSFSYTVDGNMATFVGFDLLGGELEELVDWSFFDHTSGNTINQPQVNDTTNYFFPNVGDYDVCLTAQVTDTDGNICSDMVCETITLGTTPLCEAEFIYTITNDSIVDFTAQLPPGTATDLGWTIVDQADGNTIYANFSTALADTALTYVFPNGSYEVCFNYGGYVGPDFCTDTYCEILDIVMPIPCEASLTYTLTNDTNGDFVISTPSGISIDSFHWEVRDLFTLQELYAETVTDGSNTFDYVFPSTSIYEICADIRLYSPTESCNYTACVVIDIPGCDVGIGHVITNDSIAVFSATPTQWYYTDTLTWTFTNTNTGALATQVEFDSVTTYTFPSVGLYEVCVDADLHDFDGNCSASHCIQVYIDFNQPICDVGISYTIDSDTIGNIVAHPPVGYTLDYYEWLIIDENNTYIFNQPVSDGDTTLSYTFPSDGTYEVCVTDAELLGTPNCNAINCTTVIIDTSIDCIGDLSYTIINDTIGNFIIYAPQDVNIGTFNYGITELSTGASALYTVLDGSTTFDYVFPNDGTYEVCIYVVLYDTQDTCYFETCETIVIPSCDVSIGHVMTNDSLGVFSATPTQGYYTDTLTWTFTHLGTGDVATQVETDSVTTYEFPSTGLYEVCVDADLWDWDDSCSAYACTQVLIGSPTPACVIDYAHSINANNLGSFEVLPNSIGSYSNISWLITGNGVTDNGTGSPFTYSFDDPGTYQVCVLADVLDGDGDFVCQADECKTITIGGSNTCSAEFVWAEILDALPTYGVSFENFSTNYTNAYWEFGDGASSFSTDDILSHEYQNAGNYQACLTVWDSLSNCQATYCDLITISATPTCDYDIELTVNGSVLTGEFIVYSGGNPDSTGISWYDSPSNVLYGNGYTLIHVYDDPGTYTICAEFSAVTTTCTGVICEEFTIANPSCANTDCVFPGDADYDQIANNFDLLAIGLEFGKTGPLRLNASNDWYGQPAMDWATSQANGINTKHSDCNGDGLIDFDDVDVINLNYDRTHNGVAPTNLAAMSNIYIDFEQDTIPLDPNDPNSFLITAHVMAGTDKMPVEDFYGVALTMNYPSGLTEMGNTEMIYDNNSWLGTGMETIDLAVDFYAEGELDLAFSRIDQVAANGYGRIATIHFVVTDNIIGKDLGEIPFNVSITDLKAIDEEGQLIPLGTINASTLIVFEEKSVGIKPVEEIDFEVFPNPASTVLQVALPRAEKQQITLFNTLGQAVYEAQATTKTTSINVERLAAGIYFLQLRTDEGEVTKKVLIE